MESTYIWVYTVSVFFWQYVTIWTWFIKRNNFICTTKTNNLNFFEWCLSNSQKMINDLSDFNTHLTLRKYSSKTGRIFLARKSHCCEAPASATCIVRAIITRSIFAGDSSNIRQYKHSNSGSSMSINFNSICAIAMIHICLKAFHIARSHKMGYHLGNLTQRVLK